MKKRGVEKDGNVGGKQVKIKWDRERERRKKEKPEHAHVCTWL